MIMSLGENVITYSVANIVAMATELYRVLFREMVKSDDDGEQGQGVLGVYINEFKAVTSKMVAKPLLFKYYSIYISCDWRCADDSFTTPAVRHAERAKQQHHFVEAARHGEHQQRGVH